MAGRVSEGGEVWVCALCVGGLELGEVRLHAFCISSVAATKSTKDKGSSRFFMGAKVGRKELCQGGKFFRVFGEGFLSWAIEMSAIQGPELRGGAWDLSFCGGKGGMPEPRSLWGEVWFFWAGGGDEAL